ncbi:MAG: Pseudouridine synthase [Candidatus Moranbacteria bacterium GW2011_GWC2_37_8]|nr:MAG: Pseudouridine synthase [Candidatus Moranbacteria bacterium GW2011_GWC2_37_8]KKQ62304.1 MAG: Pseudouridine synthase [Parcubacteria group bacterium GW2011_GWC1_38_22]
MEKIIVEQIGVGTRIDKFLVKEFFLYSRGEIIRRIKNGDVLVNNKAIKPSYILEEGDAIMLENFSREPEDKSLTSNKEMELSVLFENEDIIVINKQAGVQVHPSFNEKDNTLVNALLSQYKEIANVHDDSQGAEMRPGVVHRLDKDTSGVMVIARNMEAFNALKEMFKDRDVEKEYLAIAAGIFIEKEGIIEKPIARSSTYRKQVIARKNTKTIIRPAETQYKVIDEFDGYSLVEVTPKTGRMHQIRIHLASIGHPVIGDTIYGTPEPQENKKTAKRQLLHAHKLKFDLLGESYEFIAPMPQDFTDFLKNI